MNNVIEEKALPTPVRRSRGTLAGAVSGLDHRLGLVVELAVAGLVAVEIVLLFVGVVSRYVFHMPIVWSDELASILFLWLAMLGAVVALRRSEHMRMTAFVGMASPSARAVLEAVAAVAALLFLILIAQPAFEYAEEEVFITTPALGIPNAWRAAAIPVGVAIMILSTLVRLALSHGRGALLVAFVIVGAITAALIASQPVLRTLGNLNLVIFFVGVVALNVFAGVPIAFAFGLATFGYLALSTSVPVFVVIGRLDEGMSHIILLSVPLFIFLGVLIVMTGMAAAMVAFLASLLGHVRGGLSYVLVAAMYLVSGISGSKAADMAAVAPVLFPEMKKRGATSGDLVALLAATGAQTETIPPSLVLIAIGSVTSVSIAALFTGGLLPGFILGVMLCGVVWWRYRNQPTTGIRRATAKEIASAFVASLPALALPFVIRFAVIEGVATATEVATIGIAYSALAGLLLYRQLPWSRVIPGLIDTAALSGAILLIIGAASGMAWALSQSGFSASLAAAMSTLPGGRTSFLLASVVAFVILGSLLEGIPAIVLFGPLLFPIARQVGINEVHYAIVVVLSMGVGLFAPPFGVGYYAACVIGRAHPDEGMKPIIGYIIALLVGLALVTAIPWLSTGFL